jgi:hypothetical protein
MCTDTMLIATDHRHLVCRLSEHSGQDLPRAIMQAALSLPNVLILQDHGGVPRGSERNLEVFSEVGEYRA